MSGLGGLLVNCVTVMGLDGPSGSLGVQMEMSPTGTMDAQDYWQTMEA